MVNIYISKYGYSEYIFTVTILFTLLFDIFLVSMDVSFGAATLLLSAQGPICSTKLVMLLWQLINNFQLLVAVYLCKLCKHSLPM